MPPKVKITKDEIIKTALELCKANGQAAVNARSIAAAIGCSTQPIFSNFATMDELQDAVLRSAYELYASFLQNEVKSGKYPQYKALGMAYIRFAREEQELFKLLFMRNSKGKEVAPSPDFEASVDLIMRANGISHEKAKLMHFEMWIFVHGIGTMLATNYISLDEALVSDMITDVYQGIRAKHLQKEE